MIIIFEGTDGAGKTTQAEKLRVYLEEKGKDVTVLRQPGSTPLGDHLRTLIKDPPEGVEISELAERLLFAADNAQLIDSNLRDMHENKVVILDRCTFISDIPYGLSGGVLEETMNNIEAVIPNPPRATIMFLMLTSTEVAMERTIARRQVDGEKCRIEDKGRSFLSKVNDVYHRLQDDFAPRLGRHTNLLEVIDSTPSIEEVWESIKKHVDRILPPPCLHHR